MSAEERLAVLESKIDQLTAMLQCGVAEEGFLGLAECAKFIGYSERTVRQLTQKKEIPFFKKCGKLLFRKSEVAKWVEEGRVKTEDDLEGEAYLNVLRKRKLTNKN